MATLATIKGEVRRLLADLNEHAQATAQADGVTTTFPLPDQNIVGRTTVAEAVLTDATQTVTDIVNPPFPAALSVRGNTAGIAGNVVITGTDWLGDATNDTIALFGTDLVPGTTKFRTVTNISFPAQTHAGDVVTVLAPHSVTCAIDEVATEDWTMDFDSGWVEFDAAPEADAVIFWAYQYRHYNDADLLSAINNALVDVWAEAPRAKLDTTSIVPASSTYEYDLPADCARLIRVESQDSSGQPYTKMNDWRVLQDGDTKVLKFFNAPPAGATIRLCYVPEPELFVNDSDVMPLPERARWALIYLACFYLCEQKLLPRARTNQFKNAEGVNVPKIYEIQRIAADFRALAELETRKLRTGPQRWS